MRIVFALMIILSLIACRESESKTNADAQLVYVCISNTSYRYHSFKCWGLEKCTHEIRRMTIAEAEKMGKTPCKICYGQELKQSGRNE